jgi:DNA-directed RNA polymerase subunit N (RpoN/RPB10)
MIIPMRCFTCNTPIAHLKDKYDELVIKYSKSSSLINENRIYQMTEENLKEKTPEDKALNDLGLHKYCCRRMMLTHTDVIELLN